MIHNAYVTKKSNNFLKYLFFFTFKKLLNFSNKSLIEVIKTDLFLFDVMTIKKIIVKLYWIIVWVFLDVMSIPNKKNVELYSIG